MSSLHRVFCEVPGVRSWRGRDLRHIRDSFKKFNLLVMPPSAYVKSAVARHVTHGFVTVSLVGT